MKKSKERKKDRDKRLPSDEEYYKNLTKSEWFELLGIKDVPSLPKSCFNCWYFFMFLIDDNLDVWCDKGCFPNHNPRLICSGYSPKRHICSIWKEDPMYNMMDKREIHRIMFQVPREKWEELLSKVEY